VERNTLSPDDLPVTDEERGILDQRMSEMEAYEREGIRRFWYAVRKAAKVEHIRFHDLRHTAASEMLRRGLLLREVQYVLGHASARMTERYAHFAPTFRPLRAIEWGVP
jgi:integrase